MLAARKQTGFTLIEILIALVISMIVTIGILGVFFSALVGSQQTLAKGRLNRDLQAVMDMIVSDVQRAGYWVNASTSNVNPFMASGVDIAVNGNCLTLAYDLNGDGTVQDNEKFGYQLRNNAIEYRPAGASFPTNCSPTPTDWEQLTDPNFIKVTAFTLAKTNVATDIDGAGSGTDTINNRTISVTLTAQLTNDATTTKTISRTIKVYNNKYSP